MGMSREEGMLCVAGYAAGVMRLGGRSGAGRRPSPCPPGPSAHAASPGFAQRAPSCPRRRGCGSPAPDQSPPNFQSSAPAPKSGLTSSRTTMEVWSHRQGRVLHIASNTACASLQHG